MKKLAMMCPQPNPEAVHVCDKKFCETSELNKQFIENLESYISQIDTNHDQPGPSQTEGPRSGQTEGNQVESAEYSSAIQNPNPNEDLKVFHYRPNLASSFVKNIRKLLQITGDNNDLLKMIKNYH